MILAVYSSTAGSCKLALQQPFFLLGRIKGSLAIHSNYAAAMSSLQAFFSRLKMKEQTAMDIAQAAEPANFAAAEPTLPAFGTAAYCLSTSQPILPYKPAGSTWSYVHG